MKGRVWKTCVIVIALVTFLVACVATIVGISTHSEATLLKVCWEEDVAHYVEGAGVNDGSCERPEELVWEKSSIPLSAVILDENGYALPFDDDKRRAIQEAIVDINMQLGFNMLQPVNDVNDASVIVVHVSKNVDGEKDAPIAYTTHHKADGELLCSIGIDSNLGGIRMDFLASHHELLHCAGLAHDDSEQSAMFPLTRDDTFIQMRAARITDTDRKVLRKLYKEGE